MIAASVHAHVLGSSFDRLPPLLRSVHDTRLRMAGAKFLFLPLPAALFAGCGACETIVDGRYWFDARARIAGIGLLVHYKGWLAEHGG